MQEVAPAKAVDEKNMYADVTGTSPSKPRLTKMGLEVQRSKQDGFAERIVLTFGNLFRVGFKAGNTYDNAPDAMQLAILGFKLPAKIAEK